MNIIDAINSKRLEKDHGDGLFEVKIFYDNGQLWYHDLYENGKFIKNLLDN